MTTEQAKSILAALTSFSQLQRKSTDQIGWIALKWGVSRAKADRMIDQAREILRDKLTVKDHEGPSTDCFNRYPGNMCLACRKVLGYEV